VQIPGLATNPDNAATRAVFSGDGTPQAHDETNILGPMVEGVPITPASVGRLLMLVFNPSTGRICGRCITEMEHVTAVRPGIEITAIARNSAFQTGV